MPIDRDFWAGRRVLLTGHTGFKGAWLTLWLTSLGARVSGLSPLRPPTRPSLYTLAGLAADVDEHAVDIRDADAVHDAFARARPEVVLHLAAQPMVRRSLLDPVATYAVNVMGTVNVLDAVRRVGGDVRAVVVVTSDKCYENPSHAPAGPKGGGEGAPAAGQGDGVAPVRAFVEGDALGGSDPYSSSKGAAELVTAAYRRSFFSGLDAPRVASARAGNVIGGGDWGEDRLIPDIVRAAAAREPLLVRNPDAVRPWQHVLNPLAGYLLLAEELSRSPAAARAWNFGPRPDDAQPVRAIVERLASLWGGAFSWRLDAAPNPPEARYLALDSRAAERDLQWRPAWDLEHALARIVDWHHAHARHENVRETTLAQIAEFAAAS